MSTVQPLAPVQTLPGWNMPENISKCPMPLSSVSVTSSWRSTKFACKIYHFITKLLVFDTQFFVVDTQFLV